MPLLKFDLIEGRDEQEITALLDAAHRAVLAAFKVPQRDRYQIVTEHKPYHFMIQDTGLNIERTRSLVVLTVVTSPRSTESKQAFYAELTRELEESCGIAPSDVIVSIVGNTTADWSFGNGVAQYVTGEL
ncbi:tautomerase family protein [Caballeronia sp. dw_276]|uniref:tautomerase family protein n=1 Tax=Caballeronia sp. dw_276 TaxID=2719795 RepID=UPI001BD64EBF|nr:tautomerase family protein [Caballeronia sp. dw_276]